MTDQTEWQDAELIGWDEARFQLERLVQQERSEGRGFKGLSIAVETPLVDEIEKEPYRVSVLRREGYGVQTIRLPIYMTEVPEESLDEFLKHMAVRMRSLGHLGAEANVAVDTESETEAISEPASDLSDNSPFMKRRPDVGAWGSRSGEVDRSEEGAAEHGGDTGDDPLRPDGEGDVQPAGARSPFDEGESREGLPDEGLADDRGDRPASSWDEG